jgi:tRNA(Ser,Leu) C12 N-acetylase TAN1
LILVSNLEIDVETDMNEIVAYIRNIIRPDKELIINFKNLDYNDITRADCEMLRMILKDMKLNKLELNFPSSIPDSAILQKLHSLNHIRHKFINLSMISDDFL